MSQESMVGLSEDKVEKQERPLIKRLNLSTVMRWMREGLVIWALLLTFFIDQGTKQLIRSALVVGQSIPQDGPVRITHSYNTGAALGLFPNQTFLLVMASVLGIVLLLTLYRRQPMPGLLLQLSLGLQLGGAVGNLVDRITRGYVLDFIELSVWPVFNLADASIVIGVLLLAWMFMQSERKKKAEQRRVDATQKAAPSETEGNPPPDPWQTAKP